MARKSVRLLIAVVMLMTLVGANSVVAQDDLNRDNWCDDVTIRFFAGGTEGDAFAGIVYRGALAAARDTGANVEYVFSGWDAQTMTQQLREAIAQEPDGIAMMGHPGDDAILPLAEEAADAGIIMMYQNVDVTQARAQYGGGYVGSFLYEQGRALAEETLRRYDIPEGSKVVLIANLAQRERAQREIGIWDVFEENGLEIVHVDSPPEWAADPNLGIPAISAALLDNPETTVLATNGGQIMSASRVYLEAAGKAAGELIVIGFDTNETIMNLFEDGWVHLTSDQQPYLQGYIPVLSICMTAKFGLGSMNLDTGAGFIGEDNYAAVRDLAVAGYR